MILGKKWRLSSFQIIILGFVSVILLGALILMLPISSRSGIVTPFIQALFTSTSSVCVTGLIVQDTATYWSSFGQAIILLLIQIGGLGVITIIASLSLFSGKRIDLKQRSTIQDSISAPTVGGIVRFMLFILKTTFIIEASGAILMLPVLCRNHGLKGIWMAVFLSISGFCNAGFDILGTTSATYQSLTSYIANPIINIAIMLLIIFGGLGFLTWDDIFTNKHHLKRYRLQSKIILVTTTFLIIIPAVYFFFADFSEMPLNQRILCSFFQSVTQRTAGFNTTDLTEMTVISRALMMLMMMIGGSPCSTAGGMKTTTFAVLLINATSVFRRKEDTEVFGRRLENSVIRNAATIFMMYLSLFFGGAIIISIADGLSFETCLFETASAVGTVGLTLGITPNLGVVSQAVLIILMFLGRVGGLTLIFATFSSPNKSVSKLPQEKITVG